MAIDTEFIDFIVPIEKIRQKYPGGWEQCLIDHAPLLGGRVWHDDYLFRDGAMNPMDMQSIVEEWESLGFEGARAVNGKKHWIDFCVHDMMGGVTLPCDWIVHKKHRRVAHVDDPQSEVVKHLPPRDLDDDEPAGDGRIRFFK